MSNNAMAVRMGSGRPTHTSRSVTPETSLTAQATTPSIREKSPPGRRSNLELFYASAKCALSKRALVARLREYRRTGMLGEVIARLVAAVLTSEQSIFDCTQPASVALHLICEWDELVDEFEVEQPLNLRALFATLWQLVDAYTNPRCVTA